MRRGRGSGSAGEEEDPASTSWAATQTSSPWWLATQGEHLRAPLTPALLRPPPRTAAPSARTCRWPNAFEERGDLLEGKVHRAFA
jgi:hypothetical protein